MKNRSNRLYILLSTLVAVLLVAGCSFPGAVPGGAAAPGLAHSVPLVTADPNATATPTPFMPSGEDPDASGTPAPATATRPARTPGASHTPTTAPFKDRYQRPQGQVNILLLGSDFRPGSGYRTDVIMLVSLNTRLGTASVISFPRDLYVMIPGWQMQRINTAQAHGGFETTVATFEENFGVTPDHYIMTNFDGFKSIVDTLGGVEVYSEKPLSDKCDLEEAVDGYCNIGVGTYHMDGEKALWYVRSRYSTSDFDRLRRAQEVMRAVFQKLLSLNAVARAPELYNLFSSTVETDMSLTDMLPLLPLASKLSDTSQIQRYEVDRRYTAGWVTETGAQVQVPDLEAIFKDIIAPACYQQP